MSNLKLLNSVRTDATSVRSGTFLEKVSDNGTLGNRR